MSLGLAPTWTACASTPEEAEAICQEIESCLGSSYIEEEYDDFDGCVDSYADREQEELEEDLEWWEDQGC